MPTTFLILCGYGGKHPEHWQAYLANHLKAEGQIVLYPDLPNPDCPQLDEWMEYLENELSTRGRSASGGKDVNPDTLVVAAHSLGCSLWLHYVAKYPDVRPKKAFLVSPPLNDCGILEIANFFPLPDLDLSDQDYLIIGSDNDNFILEKEFKTLADQLKVPFKILPNAGHINAPMHGDWDWISQECLKLI